MSQATPPACDFCCFGSVWVARASAAKIVKFYVSNILVQNMKIVRPVPMICILISSLHCIPTTNRFYML